MVVLKRLESSWFCTLHDRSPQAALCAASSGRSCVWDPHGGGDGLPGLGRGSDTSGPPPHRISVRRPGGGCPL
jgi:hypothetical protein